MYCGLHFARVRWYLGHESGSTHYPERVWEPHRLSESKTAMTAYRQSGRCHLQAINTTEQHRAFSRPCQGKKSPSLASSRSLVVQCSQPSLHPPTTHRLKTRHSLTSLHPILRIKPQTSGHSLRLKPSIKL